MKRIATLLTMVTVAMMAVAQMANPVTFTSQLKTTNGSSEGEIVFTGKIDKGWHVYSTNLGDAGPTEASITFHKKDGVEPVGKLKAIGKEISQFDEMFGAKLRFFENNVQFVQKVKFTKPNYDIDADLEYGACNDQSCLPPFSFYELGETVFNEDGYLNENIGTEKLREYIWYTETRMPYSTDAARHVSTENANYLLGNHNDTAYYFYYEKDEITTLSHETLNIIGEKSDTYVVYADQCVIDKEWLAAKHIIFKKIPRDIRRF